MVTSLLYYITDADLECLIDAVEVKEDKLEVVKGDEWVICFV